MLLKQGYYNYQILYIPNGYTVGSYKEVEGNHSETQNYYNIYVYYREPGNDYDSFIGFLRAEYKYWFSVKQLQYIRFKALKCKIAEQRFDKTGKWAIFAE